MSRLFEPLKIRKVTLSNRIAVSPMCEYSSIDGFASDWHLVHLGSRAVGGAGLVLTEATAVSPEGRISPDDLGIWKDDHVPFLSRITAFIESQGAVPGIQLAHAGRKASHSSPWKGNAPLREPEGGWETLAPSAVPYKEGDLVPRAMESTDIGQVIRDFARAAERAVTAGFRVVEIHAAHGYLLNEFLSPLSNHRGDAYGGSFENRTRILAAIVEAVRSTIGDNLPLLVRISAVEWVENGWSLDDSVALARKLKDLGVDMIDCSSGGNSHRQKIDVKPLYQVPFAERIKKETGMPTAAVGMITTPQQAEEILASGRADLVVLARQLLREPYFPLHAARELGADVPWPVQYERAKKY